MPRMAFEYRQSFALLFLAAAAGCGGAALAPSAVLPPALQPDSNVAQRSKYIYVADRTREKLLVYPAYVADPKPIRTLGAAQGIVDIGGIAVDNAGNLYVANGAGADVLEFAPGATSLVKKYTEGLSHPINVTFSKGTLYVVNTRGFYQYGITSAIVEFPDDRTKAKNFILDPNPFFEPFRGVAVDSAGGVWTSTSREGDVWPPPDGDCAVALRAVILDFIFPTLIRIVSLSHNVEARGLAIDDNKLLASDLCGSAQRYQIPEGRYRGSVDGTRNNPMYGTISADHLVVVPCAGRGKNGYVYVASDSATITIRKGLNGPIGAAAGP